ncbi:MAG: DNA polymerase III subunit delta [Planctomycetota bacterium]
METSSHVFDFLKQPVAELPVGMLVLTGKERFLKTLALKHLVGESNSDDNSEFSVVRMEGPTASWTDVHDELSTRSLFGGDGPQIVIVDDADKFVTANRDRLEDYAKGTGGTGLLVMLVDLWTKSTRLAKLVAQHAHQVDCGPPKKSARSKSADPTQVKAWLIDRANTEYGYALPKQAAQLLFDLTECEFGRMDQELQKIALFAENGKVTLETCKQMVGGWRTRTTWEAIESALNGDAGKALDLLDLIFRGGEPPIAVFGSIAWSLRRYGNATEEVLRQLRTGQRPNMKTAIKQAGLGSWGGGDAEAELKQVGSTRAKQIHQWLLETDVQLKRSHSTETRGRLAIEKLFVRMAKELAPTK